MNNYLWLEEYLMAKMGAVSDYKAEWGWQRYTVGGKMFAATCKPGPEHRAYAGRELVSLKCDPMLSEIIQKQYPDILPGFYLDKRNWVSIFLDGETPDDLLRRLCDDSYSAVFGKLTKKLQREIEGAGRQSD